MPKIAVYTMAKNEAAHVARFAATTQGADYVVVTDTGSTDGTPDLLRDAGITVHAARILPWRFDMATNQALCNVPDNVDVCVKLDLDEVFWTPDGRHWRDVVAELWAEDVKCIRYWYNWSWHVPGQVPAVRFRTNNIHSRSHFVWRHPGHAALTCNDFSQSKKMINTDAVEIHHYMTNKTRPDYVELLQLAVYECRCPRTLYYLGREYFFREDNENVIKTLVEYLKHPDAKWKAERAEAMRMIGVTMRRTGNNNSATAWLNQAIAERPAVRDLWFELLRHFYLTEDFLGGYWAGHKTLAITARDDEFTGHTADAWLEQPYLLTARCAWHMGNRQEARTLVRQAHQLNPANQQVIEFQQSIDAAPLL